MAPQDVSVFTFRGKHMELRLGGEAAHRSKWHVNLLSFRGKESKKIHAALTDTNIEIVPIISTVIITSRKANGLIIFVIMAKTHINP